MLLHGWIKPSATGFCEAFPANCVFDPAEDTPLSELLKKGETLSDGVMRYRHRMRELDADAHRINSQQWPISGAVADAGEFIARRAEAGTPNTRNRD